MRQEDIYNCINGAFPRQHDIYEQLRARDKISTLDITLLIRNNRDTLSGFLIHYIDSFNKHTWTYDEAEDAIQCLYQRHYEFMVQHLEMYGMTPKGFKRAMRAWNKEYTNKIMG